MIIRNAGKNGNLPNCTPCITLVKATAEQREIVKAMYDDVRNTEYSTWNDEYPTEIDINYDLQNDLLYLLKCGDEYIGAASFVGENELDDMKCRKSREAREIARVVIKKEYQGRGLARILVNKMLDEARQTIHIAVAKRNIPAYKAYISCGFAVVGEAHMYGNDYYLCERLLK